MSDRFDESKLKDIFGIPEEVFSAHQSLVAGAYDLYETTNETLPEARRIEASTIEEIITREGGETPQAAKAIIDFVSTVENPATNTPTVHEDLLPAGHPLVAASRSEVAAYYSSDPRLEPRLQGIVSAAIAAEPTSPSRMFFTEQLIASGHELDALRFVTDADRLLGSK